jgi:hypothetical protein
LNEGAKMPAPPSPIVPSRRGVSDVTKHCATSQDQSVQPRYAATWRRVMQVGLLRSHGRLLRPISACGRMKLQTFFDAARLLICCEPRWAGRDMPVGLLIVMPTSIRS